MAPGKVLKLDRFKTLTVRKKLESALEELNELSTMLDQYEEIEVIDFAMSARQNITHQYEILLHKLERMFEFEKMMSSGQKKEKKEAFFKKHDITREEDPDLIELVDQVIVNFRKVSKQMETIFGE